MLLSTALRLAPPQVVALVGGGGKTTAMFRLAAELVAAGGRVVTTTTTRIFAAQIALAPRHVVVPAAPAAWPAALAQLAAALAESPHVLAIGAVEPESGKALGVPPEFIPHLRALPGGPTVLLEADGSRMRPFKAPGRHEPVIPPETTLVIPIVGADVLGAPLDDRRVHRPELVAQLAGVRLGATVTPELVAAVLAHPQGGLKGVPPAARVVVLVNKVERLEDLSPVRDLAARLIAAPAISGVVLGAAATGAPVREVWGGVAAVVLAAGRSTRMGRPKQLLPWPGGTLLGAVVRRLQACPLSRVVVVTGHEQAAVTAAAQAAADPAGPPLVFAHNSDYAVSEMARSLQVGLAALPATDQAVLVALADQPHLEARIVAHIVARWQAARPPAVAPFFNGRRGHPMLFDRAVFPRLNQLPPDANPRQLFQQIGPPEAVAVDTDAILRDLDTPEAYAAALAEQTP
ncbi:MAG: putative selenium-dependent hydroxylase accessory protein YqeC [Anaerolineales bacterium]|nr:putative selenium-dependent hydroxylase accessory protein YqeC [Anaerolineales bacterium]